MTCQNAGACEKRIQELQIQDSPLPTLDVKACCFASVPDKEVWQRLPRPAKVCAEASEG